jgi:hypothetical protein
VQAMPIVQYFVCVGSLLLTLLFFVDRNYPGVAAASRAEVDRSILRIKSAQRWPERIVFDTSAPPLLASSAMAERAASAAAPRDAFAMAPAVPPTIAPVRAAVAKPAPARRSRAARHPVSPAEAVRQANARDASPDEFWR